MKFLKTADKIKNIRKELNMTQSELADEEMSPSFISMIELEKRGLSRYTAEKIAEKFNLRAKELSIPLNIDGEYLLFSPKQEAEKYCLKKLDEIIHFEDTSDLFQISKKYGLENIEARIYKFSGDLLFKREKYLEAFIEYSHSIDLCKNTTDLDLQPYLYNRSGLCKLNLLRYPEALFLFNRANHYAALFSNDKIKKYSLYNIALCHKKLGNLEKVLEYITTCLPLYDPMEDFTAYIYINILKSDYYHLKGDLNAALEVYKKLLNDFEFNNFSISELSLIYTNIGRIYSAMNLDSESLTYFDKAQSFHYGDTRFTLSYTLIEKANLFIKQKLYEEAILLIERGIEIAEQNNNKESLLEGYQLLKKLYRIRNDIERLCQTHLRLINFYKEIGNLPQTLKVFNELALLYIDQKNYEQARKYLIMSQDLVDEQIKDLSCK